MRIAEAIELLKALETMRGMLKDDGKLFFDTIDQLHKFSQFSLAAELDNYAQMLGLKRSPF